MGCFKENSTLDELRVRVKAAHPTVEGDIDDLFDKNDVSGEGFLPYGVVDALLRHYFYEQGLSDHVLEYLDNEGRLDLDYVRGLLHENNTLVVNEETLMTCEEMKLLAVVWLKLLSDSFKSKALNQTNEAEYYKKKPYLENKSPYSELKLSVNNDFGYNYEEEQEPQDLLNSYMKSVREEVQKNRTPGITCFAYPASLTPNGSCASAGAVTPHRRLRKRREHPQGFLALLGCC